MATGKVPVAQAQTCIEADPKGKLTKLRAKLTTATAECPANPPSFGYALPNDAADAAERAAIVTTNKVWGLPLDAIALPPHCSIGVASALAKVADARNRTFTSCKKLGLKKRTITTADELEAACFGAVLVDRKGKIAKAKAKLASVVAACEGDGLAEALERGECQLATSSDARTQCLDLVQACETCKMFNAADGLAADCDLFDDGVTNGTCS
jgi:hypothetical protein